MAARRKGGISAEKLGSTAAAEVLRREHDRVQGVWWKAYATHPWRNSDAVPFSSERSDVDSWSREGDAFPPTLCAANTRPSYQPLAKAGKGRPTPSRSSAKRGTTAPIKVEKGKAGTGAKRGTARKLAGKETKLPRRRW